MCALATGCLAEASRAAAGAECVARALSHGSAAAVTARH
jgi:hypothetical protein